MSNATHSKPAVSFLPATAVLELTYQCNHKCIFCSCPWEANDGSFDKGAELTTDQWKDTISLLCEMGVANIALTGGEPLMRRDIDVVIQHAASCRTEHIETMSGSLRSRIAPPKLHLLTNGCSVDNGVLRLCKKYDVQLSISLPGLETFELHAGSDNVDGVLSCFTAAKTEGLYTVANITVTKLNLYELGDTISAALLAGADQLLLNRFIPGGRGLQHTRRLSLSAEDIRTMLDVTEDILRKSGKSGSLGTEIPKCVADISRYKHMEASTRCAAALDFFVVGPSGYTRVCNHSPIRLTHVEQLSDLKRHKYWNTFTQKRYLPDGCMDCADRNACDGGCREAAHIVGGTVCAPDVLMMADNRTNN